MSARALKILLTGAAIAAAGFWILTLTDPAGQNWASLVAPLLLLCGYGLIGISAFLTDVSSQPEPEDGLTKH